MGENGNSHFIRVDWKTEELNSCIPFQMKISNEYFKRFGTDLEDCSIISNQLMRNRQILILQKIFCDFEKLENISQWFLSSGHTPDINNKYDEILQRR